MDNQRWPAHLDALPPCKHCDGKTWAWHDLDSIWVCRCYFEPRLRKSWEERYGTKPVQASFDDALADVANLKK